MFQYQLHEIVIIITMIIMILISRVRFYQLPFSPFAKLVKTGYADMDITNLNCLTQCVNHFTTFNHKSYFFFFYSRTIQSLWRMEMGLDDITKSGFLFFLSVVESLHGAIITHCYVTISITVRVIKSLF